MSDPYSKQVKRLIREWKAEAHERELHREFTKFDQTYARWRNGEVSSGELGILIEEFVQGPIRELLEIYNNGFPDNNVAYAIVTGILQRDELPAELLEAIEDRIDFVEQLRRRGELAVPEERLQPRPRRRRRRRR